MHRIIAGTCTVCLLLGLSLGAQPRAQEGAPLQPAAGNLRWLLGQVSPNAIVPAPAPSRRRLVVSYEIPPEEFPQGYHRSATYDDALAALVFVITGETDAAAFTLHALARLQRADGSLWFSYNTANTWPDEEYHQSALVRAGALGWVGYAFTFYLSHAPPCSAGDRGCARERTFFRETAIRLGEYLLSLQVDDPDDPRYGLVRLGHGEIELAYRPETKEVIEVYEDKPALGISSENNISVWFFLRDLAALTGNARWREAADRLRAGLLRSAWNEELGQFNRGFRPWGAADPVKALDCASWGVFFLLAVGEREKARHALEAVEKYYPARDGEMVGYRPYFDHPIYKSPEVGAYFFPAQPRKEWWELPLIWSEGTAGVALAYWRLGNSERARRVLAGLRPLQGESGGVRYASREVPYQMAAVPSVAASAWFVLVTESLKGNPLAKQFWR
ncbi:MAG: hypothetical protein ACE5G6_02360 [Terriglobia bacterium]